jgi:pyruvate,water dikinase
VFKGVPGSPGSAEGEAYLVHGPEDFPHMPEGAILVARTTNPSWTPLFYKCSALITESGGPLSHGAVTARELGIPAVMFIRGALAKFRNGERLRVDGLLGTVRQA